MKLKIEHLAPYLPYGLKIQGTTHGEIAELSCCTETSVNITTRSFQYGMWADIFEIKPILRPLSDLVKLGSNERWWRDKIALGITKLDYESIQELFKEHFDVFGLIEKGLAIDINTL